MVSYTPEVIIKRFDVSDSLRNSSLSNLPNEFTARLGLIMEHNEKQNTGALSVVIEVAGNDKIGDSIDLDVRCLIVFEGFGSRPLLPFVISIVESAINTMNKAIKKKL